MPSVRAPSGGIVINGQRYNAGQWIPAGQVAAAGGASAVRHSPREVNSHGILDKLRAHQRELDPKQLAHLRSVHEALSAHWGDKAKHRIGADADALLKAYDSAKGDDHKKSLAEHLGNTHALLAMAHGKGGGAKNTAPSAAPSSVPTNAGVEKSDVRSISIATKGDTITATYEDKIAQGASAQEAVGKLVIENAESLGLVVDAEDEKVLKAQKQGELHTRTKLIERDSNGYITRIVEVDE